MDDSYYIEGYHVPVVATPDVCVIGGGAAGLSAAIGAARGGLKVVLVEKYGFCGGATVAGLSGTICGLYGSGGKNKQIVFGFADEFYQMLKSMGGVTIPVSFGKTYLVPHDGLKWKEAADHLLAEAGVKVLYHSHFLKAYTDEENNIQSLLIKSFEGQFAIRPKVVIDASGDAEVIASINGDTFIGDAGIVQTPTMIFKMGNVDMNMFFNTDPRFIDEEVTKADRSEEYDLPRHHVYAFPLPNQHEVLCNMTRITFPDGHIPLGINSTDMTYAEIAGRKQARAYANFLKTRIPAFRNAYMVDTGTQIGIRQTRSIVGKYTLSNEDVLSAKKSKSAVTHSAWPIEAHGAGDVRIVYLENDHYDIPFETLQPTSGNNILVAGRCMSAAHEALASARVTAQCFGMGYAAGAASALMCRENTSSQDLTGSDVLYYMKQQKLKTSYEK